MNIETKTVIKDVEIYEQFGWEHTEDVRKGSARHHHTEHVLVRDKNMPNRVNLMSLENRYFDLKDSLKTRVDCDPLICILLFFILIIPMAIYIAIVYSKNAKIDEHNKEVHRKMDVILEEAKKLLQK